MKKRCLVTIVLCLILILILIAFWYFFVDTSHLPTGELIASYVSPDATHTVNVYNCSGNATSGDSLRAEVITDNHKRNIYWQYDESLHICRWISENEICINDKVINVLTDTYDWRKDK